MQNASAVSCLSYYLRDLQNCCRFSKIGSKYTNNRAQLQFYRRLPAFSISSSSSISMSKKKLVWIWTENKQVMTAAVERGWNTFLFPSHRRQLADDWSAMAFISPLLIEDRQVYDGDRKLISTFSEISSPAQLEQLKPENEPADNIIVNLSDWQVIPAETIVAAFQTSHKTVLAISKTSNEAQTFLEALELGLGGVVLKVEDVESVLELKDYFDRRSEQDNILELTTAVVTRVEMVGMGDRVCVDLCNLMIPGEGILVGSFARGLFLVHSECLESNYISSRPFRVNAGPVHAYVAVPGGRTSYLSELKTGKEVIVVDQDGRQRIGIVGRVKIETRPLIIVEAKIKSNDQILCSILLQNAETVSLVTPKGGNGYKTASSIAITSLKVGDEVLLRTQGDARHTGIEIQEFVVEK
ncbi:3-dehydroquinate synthase homolog [Impatiens glandulifera]|uniref:3-dehydroquinate synthase homolog n=1 Tax=Impatiens glandulifera TaxID=253017 RepID=UPI001FB0A6C0|nr:3-dehydroquinate synthase homolog [Impatiens glandulifera]